MGWLLEGQVVEVEERPERRKWKRCSWCDSRQELRVVLDFGHMLVQQAVEHF
jgi:hypothetical protein